MHYLSFLYNTDNIVTIIKYIQYSKDGKSVAFVTEIIHSVHLPLILNRRHATATLGETSIGTTRSTSITFTVYQHITVVII